MPTTRTTPHSEKATKTTCLAAACSWRVQKWQPWSPTTSKLTASSCLLVLAVIPAVFMMMMMMWQTGKWDTATNRIIVYPSLVAAARWTAAATVHGMFCCSRSAAATASSYSHQNRKQTLRIRTINGIYLLQNLETPLPSILLLLCIIPFFLFPFSPFPFFPSIVPFHPSGMKQLPKIR